MFLSFIALCWQLPCICLWSFVSVCIPKDLMAILTKPTVSLQKQSENHPLWSWRLGGSRGDRFVPLLKCSLMWRWQREKYTWVCGMVRGGTVDDLKARDSKAAQRGHMSWGLKNSDGQLDEIKKIWEMTLEVQENGSNKNITTTNKTKHQVAVRSYSEVWMTWTQYSQSNSKKRV